MPNQLNNLKLDHIEEWPFAIKATAIIAVFIVVIIVGHLFVGSGKLDKLKREQQYFEELQKQYTKNYRKYRKFHQIEIDMQHDQKKLNTITNMLPSKDKTHELNTAIQTAANQSGIRITSFKANAIEEHEHYTITPLHIKAQANYHQAANFLSDIANFKQVIIIGDFALKQPTEKKRTTLDFDVTLKLYQLKDNADE
ncbi:MAG: type 4a pilus biogenesis protein PilO [Coxiellaceae bacterium]|nr:type 4a pilus biogenesis protein PilO [Coxiellaceae bacterium]